MRTTIVSDDVTLPCVTATAHHTQFLIDNLTIWNEDERRGGRQVF